MRAGEPAPSFAAGGGAAVGRPGPKPQTSGGTSRPAGCSRLPGQRPRFVVCIRKHGGIELARTAPSQGRGARDGPPQAAGRCPARPTAHTPPAPFARAWPSRRAVSAPERWWGNAGAFRAARSPSARRSRRRATGGRRRNGSPSTSRAESIAHGHRLWPRLGDLALNVTASALR
jgi:hypothetical protein